MTSIAVGYILALIAGVSFVIQQTVNADLRVSIGSAWWAGFVSYLGGTIIMLLVALAFSEALPTGAVINRSSWVSWTGGFFGSVYIAISILLLPRLGAAPVIAPIVAGQMLTSLTFDQFGLMGVPVHEVSILRVVGAAFLVGGVVLIRL